MTHNPATLPAEATLTEAASIMRERDIGNVIVTNEDGGICGIVTDRDLVVRAIAQGKDPSTCKLDEICSDSVVTLSADEELDEAIHLMRDKGVRRLPVEEDGEPIGILSLGDLAKSRDGKSVLGQISARAATR